MNELVAQWWLWFGNVSIQFTVLVLIVLALEQTLLRRAWPELRSAVWMVAVARLILAPGLSSPWGIARAGVTVPAIAAPADPTHAGSWPMALFLVWLTGFVATGGLGLARYLRLRREWLGVPACPAPRWLAACAARAARRLGLLRAPPMRIIACAGPALIGFFRPVVVLPEALVLAADRGQVEHVLLHELAHLRRRDPWASLLCVLLQVVYWFHPLVWLTRARLSFLREICCDRTVALVLGDHARDYRTTLLRMARPLLAPALPGLGFIHRHSQILARLSWLERPLAQGRGLRRVLTAAVCGALLLCCVPLAAPPRAAPGFADLQGCLQKRFHVLRLLAEQEQAAAPH